MTSRGVILYGPPASGKDTVTRALVELDPVFRHYRRLKVGDGRAASYEMVDAAELDHLRERGEILYENARYGNRYAVDRPRLQALCDAGAVPVVHLGQVAGVRALTASFRTDWLPVLLWCSREISEARATERSSADVTSRLDAWDETARDIDEHGVDDFALCINTEEHDPDEAAKLIHEHRQLELPSR
jgi:guanylate kinase